jgi:hypothetical protein
VKRLLAWLSNLRRPVVRYERRVTNLIGLALLKHSVSLLRRPPHKL